MDFFPVGGTVSVLHIDSLFMADRIFCLIYGSDSISHDNVSSIVLAMLHPQTGDQEQALTAAALHLTG